MKTITIIICAALSWNIHAEEQPEASEIETIVRAVEQTTGWTADELKAGLDRLDRLYQTDMKDKNGRIRWHGPIIRTEYRTNDLVKVHYHEDGFTHSEPFHPVKVPPVKEQISKAAFDAANKRLLVNCVKCALDAAPWYSRQRYILLAEAWAIYRACSKFGWSAWLAAYNQNQTNK